MLNNLNEYSKNEAFSMLLQPNCGWESSILRVNRLDYVTRDLFLTGTVNVQMDLDGLLATVNSNHDDWNLVSSLDRYLTETIYCHPKIETIRSLFIRLLSDHLIKKKLDVERLFGLGTQKPYSDEDVIRTLVKSAAGKELFNFDIRSRWNEWEIRTATDPESSPYETATEITGHDKTYLTAPFSNKVFCYKPAKMHHLNFATKIGSNGDRPKLRSVVKMIRSIARAQKPFLSFDDLANALWESISGHKVKHKLWDVAELLSKQGIVDGGPINTIRKASAVVHRSSGWSLTLGTLFSRQQ